MENQEVIKSETAYELLAAQMERQVKRMFILCVTIFISFALFVAWWAWRETKHPRVDAAASGMSGQVNIISGGNVTYNR